MIVISIPFVVDGQLHRSLGSLERLSPFPDVSSLDDSLRVIMTFSMTGGLGSLSCCPLVVRSDKQHAREGEYLV